MTLGLIAGLVVGLAGAFVAGFAGSALDRRRHDAQAAEATADAVESATAAQTAEAETRQELSDLDPAARACRLAVAEDGTITDPQTLALCRELYCRAQTNTPAGGTSQTDCAPISQMGTTLAIMRWCRAWADDVAGQGLTAPAADAAYTNCVAEFSRKH